jgi:hypothetical protein
MDTGPVKIFTVRDVPRLRYIVEILLGDILGLTWEIVTDKRKLGKNPVINYSEEELKESFKISPDGLLSETGLKNIVPVISEWKGLPVFFPTSAGSDLPFDIFSASFYLISRYEEYLDFVPDQFGRFRASDSLAFKNKFLRRSVIELWARELAKTLLLRFRNMTFKRHTFRSILTIDIDQPFAYLGKDIFRSIGGLFSDIGTRKQKAVERYRTVAKGEKDPFDVFDYIFDKIEMNVNDVHFFIPTGDRSVYDKNPSWQNEDYRRLIGRVSGKFSVGLHPSFAASEDSSTLMKEKERLENLISKEIHVSRFHYIKLRFPSSCRNLLKAGIKEDYSMGYPEEPGFRAGISRPFYFFDLLENTKTDLKITPFQVMDGTLSQYKGLTPEAAESTIAEMINETRRTGGTFVSLWHNTTLLDTPACQGWRSSFEKMLILQKQ